MGLFDRFRTDSAVPGSQPKTVTITEELSEKMTEATVEAGPVVSVIPYERENNSGLASMKQNRQFFRNMWSTRREGSQRKKNASPPWAFELVYRKETETIEPRYATTDEQTRGKIVTDADSCYQDADINIVPERFADWEVGQAASAAHLVYREREELDYLKPISNYEIAPDDFTTHPYDNITSVMADVGPDGEESSVVAQVTMRPAISISEIDDLPWYSGALDLYKQISEDGNDIRWVALFEELAKTFMDPNDEHGGGVDNATKKTPNTQKNNKAAELVADLEGTLGYDVNVRVVAFADDEDEAARRVASVAEKYESFYNAKHGQGFRPVYDVDVEETLLRSIRREWTNRQMPMDLWSLAGLSGPPLPISTRGYETTRLRNDSGAPTEIPNPEEWDEMDYFDPDTPLSESPLTESDGVTEEDVADALDDVMGDDGDGEEDDEDESAVIGGEGTTDTNYEEEGYW